MRIVLIASAPQAALGLSRTLAGLHHDVPALVSIRAPAGRYGPDYPSALHGVVPDGDLVFVRSGDRLGPLLAAYDADLAVCASFPARIPVDALTTPRLGILNVHPAFLPRYRGPNPMGWALRNGDAEIGLTAHRMVEELDAGPIYAQAAVPVGDGDDPVADAAGAFARASERLMGEALDRVARGDPGDPQDEAAATYAGPFERAYLEVDWTRTAREIRDQTRAWALAPPVGGVRGPLTEIDGRRVRILRARLDGEHGGRPVPCADGPLWVLETEPA